MKVISILNDNYGMKVSKEFNRHLTMLPLMLIYTKYIPRSKQSS